MEFVRRFIDEVASLGVDLSRNEGYRDGVGSGHRHLAAAEDLASAVGGSVEPAVEVEEGACRAWAERHRDELDELERLTNTVFGADAGLLFIEADVVRDSRDGSEEALNLV